MLRKELKEFRQKFKAAEKKHSDDWTALYAAKREVESLCYDGMAIEDAFKLLDDTAKIFERASKRAKGVKRK